MTRNRPELWFYRGTAAGGGLLAAFVAIRKLISADPSVAFHHWFDVWLMLAPVLTAIILLWVAARLGIPEERPVILAGCRTGLILGAIGFVAGFFGPILLAPDANQGPLLGIFITGPAGAIFGTLIGVAVAKFRAGRNAEPPTEPD